MTATRTRFASPSPVPVGTRAAGHGAVANGVRITIATLIVVCLSGAPFVSISRWVIDEPLALETWPYVYSMWGATLLGAAMFVLDVVAPITSQAARPLRVAARRHGCPRRPRCVGIDVGVVDGVAGAHAARGTADVARHPHGDLVRLRA